MLRRFCVSLSVLFLLYGALLTAYSLPGFPSSRDTRAHWPWLADKPVGEDGFYMLTVADHIAREHRIVYNYDLPATGFQPLTTFLWAGIAWGNAHAGGDSWSLIRLILFFSCCLFLGFAWLLADFAASLAPPGKRDLVLFLAFALTLLDFGLFRLFTYGLETGPYLSCLLLCFLLWHRIIRHGHAGWRTCIELGLMAGITGLARIDFGLIFAFVLVYMLVRRYATPLQVLVCGLLALVLVSPWFLYVHSVTGGWLPSSGKAEGEIVTAHTLYGRLFGAFTALLAHLVPWSFAGAGSRTLLFAELCFLGLLIAAILGRRTLRPLFTPELKETLLPWSLGFAVLCVIYVAFFWTGWFYPRYFSVILLAWVPVLALAGAEVRWIRHYPALVGLVLLAVFGAEAFGSLHTGHTATNHLTSAGYIRENYPSARVGAFQSGVIGFLDPNVFNLDGKMNDDALRADATHHLDDYLDRSNIDVLVDWNELIRHHLPASYLATKWEACPKPMPVPDSVCFVRRKR